MTSTGETAREPLLAAAAVLEQVQTAVVVTDAHGDLRYANSFAVQLFGFPEPADQLAGRSLHSLGFEEGDAPRTGELTQQVLRGRTWKGRSSPRGRTVPGCSSAHRPRRCAIRPGITGVMIMAREAAGHGSERARDRIGLLEVIGERLARSLELDTTLRHVAETLVPQFADHCFIDLYQGEKLIRRAQRHSGG